jgi:hypothetical protein
MGASTFIKLTEEKEMHKMSRNSKSRKQAIELKTEIFVEDKRHSKIQTKKPAHAHTQTKVFKNLLTFRITNL